MKNRILFLIINFCTVTFLVANSRNPFDDVESSESYSESGSQLERPVSPSMPDLTLIHQEKVSPPPLLYFPHLDQQVQPMPKAQVPFILPLYTQDQFQQFYLQCQNKRLEQKQLQPFQFNNDSQVSISMQPFSIEEKGETRALNAQEKKAKAAVSAALERKNREKFPCPVCKKYFLSKFHLNSHLDDMHWPHTGKYVSRRRYSNLFADRYSKNDAKK